MHDFLLNGCFVKLQRAFEAKAYDVAFFQPPCHTFSICRFRYMSGFPILRTIFDITGSNTTGAHLVTVTAVNTIIERICDLIMILHEQGRDWAIEFQYSVLMTLVPGDVIFQQNSSCMDLSGRCLAWLP